MGRRKEEGKKGGRKKRGGEKEGEKGRGKREEKGGKGREENNRKKQMQRRGGNGNIYKNLACTRQNHLSEKRKSNLQDKGQHKSKPNIHYK